MASVVPSSSAVVIQSSVNSTTTSSSAVVVQSSGATTSSEPGPDMAADSSPEPTFVSGAPKPTSAESVSTSLVDLSEEDVWEL